MPHQVAEHKQERPNCICGIVPHSHGYLVTCKVITIEKHTDVLVRGFLHVRIDFVLYEFVEQLVLGMRAVIFGCEAP